MGVPSVRLLAHDDDMGMEAERFATQFNPWATNFIRPNSFTLIIDWPSNDDSTITLRQVHRTRLEPYFPEAPYLD